MRRQDARQTVDRLRGAGIRVMVLSGDNVAAARALAARAGIAAVDVTAGVGPAGKMEFVKDLRNSGAVRHPQCPSDPTILNLNSGLDHGVGMTVTLTLMLTSTMNDSVSDVELKNPAMYRPVLQHGLYPVPHRESRQQHRSRLLLAADAESRELFCLRRWSRWWAMA